MSSCRYRCRSRLLLNWPWLTWRAPRVWRPLPASLAGGAGARPAHPISGHERTAFAAMHGPDLLYSHDPWVWGRRDEAGRPASVVRFFITGTPDGSESFLTSFHTGGSRETQDFPSHCRVGERHRCWSANDRAFRCQGGGSIDADASPRRAGVRGRCGVAKADDDAQARWYVAVGTRQARELL